MRVRYFLICLVFLLSGFEKPMSEYEWTVMRSSKLAVNGSTNVNKFKCDVSEYVPIDTIGCHKMYLKEKGYTMYGGLKIDVTGFNCHNPMMTADLRKTLKAKEHPKLFVRFLNIARLPELKQHAEQIPGWAEIEIAGVIKRMDMMYSVSSPNSDLVILKGKRQVLFSDFDIKPPTRLGGIVRVNNELDVEFTLHLKPFSKG